VALEGELGCAAVGDDDGVGALASLIEGWHVVVGGALNRAVKLGLAGRGDGGEVAAEGADLVAARVQGIDEVLADMAASASDEDEHCECVEVGDWEEVDEVFTLE
jgi:hypothetical protein